MSKKKRENLSCYCQKYYLLQINILKRYLTSDLLYNNPPPPPRQAQLSPNCFVGRAGPLRTEQLLGGRTMAIMSVGCVDNHVELKCKQSSITLCLPLTLRFSLSASLSLSLSVAACPSTAAGRAFCLTSVTCNKIQTVAWHTS